MIPYHDDPLFALYHGDALAVLKALPDQSAHCCVTSPPYWGLRDYGVAGQLGLEKTPDEYVSKMVEVFREVKRVLRDDGTLWLNLGDSYSSGGRGGGAENSKQRTNVGSLDSAQFRPGANRADGQVDEESPRNRNGISAPGFLPKNLIGMPWRVAFALQADGWYLRCDIIWHKPNPMPESVTDRPTKSHEYIFLLSKSQRYYYDAEAIKEPAVAGDNGSSFLSEYDLETKQNLGKGPRKKLLSWDERKSLGEGSRRGFCQNGHSNIGNDSGLRNKRSVWTVATSPYPEAHFATYPPDLIKPCIMAGSPTNGIVIDPFAGSGTTGQVALELGRKAVLIELNEKYLPLIQSRLFTTPGLKLA